MCLRAYVHTCARAYGSHRSTPNPVTRLLKRFTAKMPLCKCLIINKIKYFLKFFAIFFADKENGCNFAIGYRKQPYPRLFDIRKQRRPQGCCIGHSRQGDTPETTPHTIRRTLLLGLMRYCFHPLQVARGPGSSLLGILCRSGSTPEATARIYVKRFKSLHYESNK